ncbi:ABC transporter ATP-binding protein (plasmid) [Cytobacillus oceanisediminis]|uniref:ABC transporter ATP-binding protein n=1 Tax=Cytobacillus oceanisediminis TaxID=665099 RepID=UPI001863ED2C|nr:ABC transporter ATP-binding protein [Cytobacillus oceanisediminis]QOK29888.1 ABC transporter ATP-binding protein [Cytobacillus oceanisediminis]
MTKPILEVKDLSINFHTERGVIPAVKNCSFTIESGETVCIVGESGSGKSVSSLGIMGLLPKDTGRADHGEILFGGQDLLKKNKKDMRRIRGNEISMIFQEPMTSLNPVYTVGDQIAESLRFHKKMNKKQSMEKAIEFLKLVGIPSPEQRINEYPHQLSGGMRQRIMIAMALACDPKLLIADEPTTALDVTIQAQVLELMKDLKEKLGMSILFITHDLGVVADIADRVVVMYAGVVVEEATVWEIFANPYHPYTLGLLEAMPTVDAKGERLKTIEGTLPNPTQLPGGCRFNPRCRFASELCRNEEPTLEKVDGERRVACWHYDKLITKEVI